MAEAVANAIRRTERAGLSVLRVDADDWVTIADIARRVGRSREAVRLWSLGLLGPGGFPPPLNPGRETSFFSWTEVGRWLERVGFDLADEEPVLAAANLAVQLRALIPRLTVRSARQLQWCSGLAPSPIR